MSQRKLIRPKLSEVRGGSQKRTPAKPSQGRARSQSTQSTGRKPTPPEQTFAEVYYYLKQMQSRSPMIVVLKDGEVLQGWIEWYDKNFIKLNRNDKPNLLLNKDVIKYMHKDEEGESEKSEK